MSNGRFGWVGLGVAGVLLAGSPVLEAMDCYLGNTSLRTLRIRVEGDGRRAAHSPWQVSQLDGPSGEPAKPWPVSGKTLRPGQVLQLHLDESGLPAQTSLFRIYPEGEPGKWSRLLLQTVTEPGGLTAEFLALPGPDRKARVVLGAMLGGTGPVFLFEGFEHLLPVRTLLPFQVPETESGLKGPAPAEPANAGSNSEDGWLSGSDTPESPAGSDSGSPPLTRTPSEASLPELGESGCRCVIL